MSDEPVRIPGTYVHDLRHRCSIELRPAARLDAQLRSIAHDLEAAGLLLPGASTAPRFHPHLTLARSAAVDHELVLAVARAVGAHAGGAWTFDRVGTFGEGRIVYLALADEAPAHAARAVVVDRTAPADLDPLVRTREWTPHVTLAYAVPEHARAATVERIAAQLPISGRCATVEAWDLDVRPTLRLHQATIDPA